jgi:hypothetical protein
MWLAVPTMTFARNHAAEPVGFRLQSPPTLEVTTANEGARWPLVRRGLAVY